MSTEKRNKKSEMPWWSSNVCVFAQVKICLTSKISEEIWQMVILLENVLQREFDVAVFMVRGILLGNGFWVVNTWQAPVLKRFKR